MNWNFWGLILLGLLLLAGLFMTLEERRPTWSFNRLAAVVGAAGLLWGVFAWVISR